MSWIKSVPDFVFKDMLFWGLQYHIYFQQSKLFFKLQEIDGMVPICRAVEGIYTKLQRFST